MVANLDRINIFERFLEEDNIIYNLIFIGVFNFQVGSPDLMHALSHFCLPIP
jgi:hypothetical protein